MVPLAGHVQRCKTMLEKKSSHVDEIKIHFLLQGNAELRVLVKRCWEDDLKKIQTSLSSS